MPDTLAARVLRVAAPITLLCVMVYSMSLRRSRRPQRLTSDASLRLLAQGKRRLLSKLLDVGGFFGADIGGTLSKLVFFLPDKELATRMLQRAAPARAAQAQWASKLAAIHKIAGFILSRETYGATGVRDAHLSFRLAALGGSFHFIRFETRRFEGALRLAQRHGLNAGMERICATGGGAHKVRGRARVLAHAAGAHLHHPPRPFPAASFARPRAPSSAWTSTRATSSTASSRAWPF
jgi:hypothetical protein